MLLFNNKNLLSRQTRLLSKISTPKIIVRGGKTDKLPPVLPKVIPIANNANYGSRTLLKASAKNSMNRDIESYNRSRLGPYIPKRGACTRARFDEIVPKDKEVVQINEPLNEGIDKKFGIKDKDSGNIGLLTKCKAYYDKFTESWKKTEIVGTHPISDLCCKNEKGGIPTQKIVEIGPVNSTPITDTQAENFDIPVLESTIFLREIKKAYPLEHEWTVKEIVEIDKAKFNREDRAILLEDVVKEAKRRIEIRKMTEK